MSLFGATPTTATSSGAAAPTFSFGAPTSTSQLGTAAPPTTSTSLFGALTAPKPTTTGTTTSTAPTTFSFGGAAAAPASTSGGGGLFGAPQQQQQAGTAATGGGGGGLFGSTAPATGTATGGGGGGLFGAGPTTATAQTNAFAPTASTTTTTTAGPAPATAANTGGTITKSTKFNDLPDAARSAVEDIEKFIRGQCQLADQLKAKDLGGDIAQTQRLYEQYSAEASTVTSALQTDARLLASLRSELEQSLNDLTKTTLLIENFKSAGSSSSSSSAAAAAASTAAGMTSSKGHEGGGGGGGVNQFPYEYFRRKADEMKDRVKRYRATMDQIASLLSSPSHSLSPTALVPTLKAQHASLVSLASAVSALDLDLKRLKEEYRSIWREKTGRVVDPFRINGGGASGVGIERNLRGVEIR
ncbi:hypothetical protein BMF94_4022 [Rhodotorula taiwanensis]|uniref:Uncharacterized protein n=1 Tax=Rhodotorula taiwanensis TaxID=741276 RepID=A0A2S5B849_9BASI|nr:hypothetical protein BMF94_4022 [Rhodotorula taiwanensis]